MRSAVIMSAKTFGVECSTVAGKLMMHLRCGVGCQASVTASTTRLENASSVLENISGEYSKLNPVRGCEWASCLMSNACETARSTTWSSDRPSTTRRIIGARSKKQFSIGDQVRVRLDRVNAAAKQLEFSLVVPPRAGHHKKKKQR